MLTLALATALLAAEPAKPAIAVRPVPADAHRIALADAERLSDLAPLHRWLWVKDGVKEDFKAAVLALNYVSRSAVLVRPEPVAGGRLVRVDLQQIAPKVKDLADWLRVWEEFRFDPAFSLLITRDTVDLLNRAGRESLVRVVRVKPRKVWVEVPPYTAVDGKTYDWKWIDAPEVGRSFDEVSLEDVKDFDVIRLDGLHLDAAVTERLIELTGTEAPVVDARYFIARALSTIKDKGPYKTIFGGLYYDLVGIDRNPAKGTAEDALYASLGLGDVDKGFTATDLLARLDADQRLAVFRSGVTGKPRRTDFLNIPNVRIYEPILSVTHDAGDADIDVGQHPLLNLEKFRDKAREVIFVRPNGLHGYALFDNKGALQDEVPPDVATDRTVPAPHTARLQCAISCLRCHVVDGSEGWRPLENDARVMLAGKRTAVYGDTDDPTKSIAETVDRAAGQYAGDVAKRLRRGREDLAEVVLRCTGPWDQAREDQSDVAQVAVRRIADIYAGYVYEMVDARIALAEIGLDVPAKEASTTLLHLLRPARGVDLGGFVPVDPRLGALLNDLRINRIDWAFVQTFAAARARRAIADLKPEAAREGVRP